MIGPIYYIYRPRPLEAYLFSNGRPCHRLVSYKGCSQTSDSIIVNTTSLTSNIVAHPSRNYHQVFVKSHNIVFEKIHVERSLREMWSNQSYFRQHATAYAARIIFFRHGNVPVLWSGLQKNKLSPLHQCFCSWLNVTFHLSSETVFRLHKTPEGGTSQNIRHFVRIHVRNPEG